MCDRAPPAAAAAAAAAAPAAAAAATPPGMWGATDGDTAKPPAPALQLLSWLGFGLTPGCCCSLLPAAAAAAAQGPSPSEQCAAAAVRRLNSIPLLCRCSRRLLLWRFRRERQLLHRARHYSMLRKHTACSVAASARADPTCTKCWFTACHEVSCGNRPTVVVPACQACLRLCTSLC
jgi:hypothetical protein